MRAPAVLMSVLACTVLTAPAVLAVAQSTPPDVIIMKDGGMLRGTIAESVPGKFVVMMMLSGETRRVEFSEVRFAGPASQAPATAPNSAPAPASAAAGDPRVAVRFEAANPEQSLTFFRKVGESTGVAWGYGGAVSVRAVSFRQLCKAPCAMGLKPSTETLAVALNDGSPVPVREAVNFEDNLLLRASYNSRSGIRIGGWVILGVGNAAGAGMMLAPILFGDEPGELNTGMLIAGAATMTVSSIAGMIMAFQGDKVTLDRLPGAATP